MPWLVLDTAMPRAVVAVVDVNVDVDGDGDDVVVRAERFLDDSRRHAEAIADAALAVVRDAGLAVADLEGVGAGCGPGSFIGVRTGLSFALGLGRGASVPVVGLSGCVALAGSVDAAHDVAVVAVVIDAKRGERYVAVVSDDVAGDVVAVAPAAVAGVIGGAGVVVGVIDDVASVDGVVGVALAGPSGLGLGRALRQALRRAQRDGAPAPVVPVYVRGADAKVPMVDPAARRHEVLQALDVLDGVVRGGS